MHDRTASSPELLVLAVPRDRRGGRILIAEAWVRDAARPYPRDAHLTR
jgi:hypothetical protein